MFDAVTVSYAASAGALLVGVVVALALLADDAVERGRGQFAWLLVIPGFAAVSYLLMAAEIGIVTVDGESVYLLRYVDWLVTTPVLVGYVGYVAGAPRKWIVGVALADAAMILTGLGATLATGVGTWVGFGLSAGFHAVLLGVLYLVFPRYAKRHPDRRRLFNVLQNHVGLLWIAYPLIWLASPVGLSAVGAVGTSMIIAYLDAVAKTPYVYFVWRERFGFADRSEDAAELPDSGSGAPGPAGSPSND